MPTVSEIFSHKYWFEKNGIHAKDVPIALVYFKTLSYTSYGIILCASYRYRFANKLLKSKIGRNVVNSIKTTFPKTVQKIEDSSVKISNYLSTNKYFQKIPEVLGLKAKRFSKALVETTIIYKLSLPLYFYGTYKLIQRRNLNKSVENEN